MKCFFSKDSFQCFFSKEVKKLVDSKLEELEKTHTPKK